jgi:hypothetical protein
MAQVRMIGVLALLWAAPATAESVSIRISPNGAISLELSAANQKAASSLGAELAGSLGCRLSGATILPVRQHWIFRGQCLDVLQRHGQVLTGELKLASFRRAVIGSARGEIEVSVDTDCTPYALDTFPSSWDHECNNGVIHRSAILDPEELPEKPLRIAIGYRAAELAMIFGPWVASLLLAIAWMVYLDRCVRRSARRDAPELYFCYLRAVAYGFTGLFLLRAMASGAITRTFDGEGEMWALFSAWQGGSILAGRMLSFLLTVMPALLAAALGSWWMPQTFGGRRYRVLDDLKVLFLPAMAWMVAADWTIGAFAALAGFQLGHVVSRLWIAVVCAVLIRFVLRNGREQGTARLTSGEVSDRLQALAGRCGATLKDVQVAPLGAGALSRPIDAEGGSVVISEYVLKTWEPAEIEAEVARHWSMPLRKYPEVRRVLLFFGALCAGIVPGLLIAGISGLFSPGGAIRIIFPATIACSIVIGLWLNGKLHRRAGRHFPTVRKVAETERMPWEWESFPESTAAATGSVPVHQTVASPLFSSSWRKTASNVKSEAMIFALCGPPLLVAIGIRSGWILEAARWPAYLAGIALALLLRQTVSNVLSWASYRGLRKRMAERMRLTESEDVVFVGVSPATRPLVYDGFYDWDVGFLTLGATRLDYRGEQTQFSLLRNQVTDIRLAKGAPHWSDPLWVYVAWRDEQTGQSGTIPLIVPRVRSPWRLPARVRELYRRLHAWKDGLAEAQTPCAPAALGLPDFPSGLGTAAKHRLTMMAATVIIGSTITSLVGGFSVASGATVYFAVVWVANVILDLAGHRLVRPAA